MKIRLPWPPKELNPNARCHWAKKARVTKKYRHDCWVIALQQIGRQKLPEGELHLWITFYPPDRRKRDDDNLTRAFKAGRDGLADALKIDDNRFRMHPYVSKETGGCVEVMITGQPDER